MYRMVYGKVYRNLKQLNNKKIICISLVLKMSLFTLKKHALRRRGSHHVVCFRAPTILDSPLLICKSDIKILIKNQIPHVINCCKMRSTYECRLSC